MSTKSVLAADRRWQQVHSRIKQLMSAQAKADIYTAEWYDLRDQLDQQHRILTSCNVATREAMSLQHTTQGDFTHLAAVGTVCFYRGAHA